MRYIQNLTIPAAILLLLIASPLRAGDTGAYPLDNLSAEEHQRLREMQPVIKVLEDAGEISLAPDYKQAAVITERFQKLDPNFLAEAFFVLPVPSGSEQKTLEDVKWFLQDVTRFQRIPYYSEQNEKWFPLFEDMEISALPMYDNGAEGVVARQHLKPFKPYTAVYRYELSRDNLMYSTWNEDPLKYRGFRGVAPEEMYTYLYAEAREGEIFFYGLGGAKAFTFFGLFGNRLDQAFTGRVEAFFSWFYREFVYPRLDTAESEGASLRQHLSLPEPYNNPPEIK